MKEVGLLSSLSMQDVSASGSRKTARHLADLRKAAPKTAFPETTVLKAIVLNPAIKSGIAQSGIAELALSKCDACRKSPIAWVSRPSLPGCKSAFAARSAQSVVMTQARRRPAAIGDTIASEPGLHLGAMGGE
jgi:hypothetical protein